MLEWLFTELDVSLRFVKQNIQSLLIQETLCLLLLLICFQ